MRGRFHRHRSESQELNITAFMNLMVILVPFLLITAVFSRMTILELNLPAASSGGPEKAKELQLEVVIRANNSEVGDRLGGLFDRIERSADGRDLKRLSLVLQRVKERYPDKTDATILSEPDTPYDTLVHVMDAVRVVEQVSAGSVTRYELFPDISIGDAPVRAAEAGARGGQS
jgi:biopolymer transport protein ExbD